MYVTTFYSFKGGVGRTMALVNSAVELARRGRRVLVVDFDLEAPGLDTFELLRLKTQVPGIIDFVSQYLASGQSPAAEHFIGETAGAGDQGGRLWIMPSGARQDTYAASFSRIDWRALYERHAGYLLFEDLKAQWREQLNPDYVLIDSRTGHTDTGGICTRQLPDAVVVLFFPNEQNLRGLTKVVRDIRAEADGRRKKAIELHFVMSNVPDLDDEDRILDKQIDAFRDGLGFEQGPLLVVHRYNSLSLLNQVVFTQDRPRSRLSREYHELVKAIVSRNLRDRDGALDYIQRVGRHWRRPRLGGESPDLRDRNLQRIETFHAGDGEVLFLLAALRDEERQPDQAGSLLDRAIAAGYEKPEAFLQRAHVRWEGGDTTGAGEDARRVLGAVDVPPALVREAVVLATFGGLHEIADAPAISSLGVDDQLWLASTLEDEPPRIGLAASILEPIVADTGLPSKQQASARSQLAIAYLGTARCADAQALLQVRDSEVGIMNQQDAFNAGMASWGATGAPSPKWFALVVELHQHPADEDIDRERRESANYLQCMAISCWAVGEAALALEFELRARKAVPIPSRLGGGRSRPTRRRSSLPRGLVFSSWRYRRVDAEEFAKDLDEIRALIDGDISRKPRFVTQGAETDT